MDSSGPNRKAVIAIGLISGPGSVTLLETEEKKMRLAEKIVMNKKSTILTK